MCNFNCQRQRFVEPEVLQSGFVVNFYFGLANFGKSPANFSANFDGESFREFFGLSRISGPSPPKNKNSRLKFTPRIVGHSSPISLLEPKLAMCFFTLIFCLVVRSRLGLRTLRPLTAFKKAPNPKFCRKVVPTIVFRGSNQGGPNLSKFVEILTICPEIVIFQIFNLQIFDKFGPPWLEPRKTIVGTTSRQIWGSGPFESCEGPEGSQDLGKFLWFLFVSCNFASNGNS